MEAGHKEVSALERDEAQLMELVHAFQAGTLPLASWTHAAHLVVGLWHVMRYGAERALSLLRMRIRRYNEVAGVPNTERRGYHETITRFHVRQLAAFVERSADKRDFVSLVRKLAADPLSDRDFIFRWYSRDRLMSATARRRWLAPDRDGTPSAGSAGRPGGGGGAT